MSASDPLRVLVLTETYAVGGCDRFLADLAGHLDPSEAQLIFAGNPHPDLDGYFAARIPDFGGRDVVELSNMREPLLGRAAMRLGLSRRARGEDPGGAGPQPGAPSRSPIGRLEDAVGAAQLAGQRARNLRRMRALIRRHRPDVLHANNGGYAGAESVRIAPLAAAREGVPSVQFVHNMPYPVAFPQAAERRLDRSVDRSLHVWITAAHRASDALARERGFPRAHVETVHYGVPPAKPQEDAVAAREEMGFDEGATGVLMVASFEPRKGHRVLIDAVARAEQAGARLQVALVGVGAEREAAERQVQELGVAERFRFLGWHTDVDRLMAACDLLALPSLAHECLPYAILEAMSHGKPVVSTDVAGIPEMVSDGVTGSVVPPGDAGALADALIRLASDPERREREGAAGRERIEREFGLERMAAAMTGHWRAAAESSSG